MVFIYSDWYDMYVREREMLCTGHIAEESKLSASKHSDKAPLPTASNSFSCEKVLVFMARIRKGILSIPCEWQDMTCSYDIRCKVIAPGVKFGKLKVDKARVSCKR